MISQLSNADAPMSPSSCSAAVQRRAIFNASLECCTELVTRCPANCSIAVRQGIVALVTSYISAHINPPPNPVALRLLYQLILCKEHAAEVYDAMMCAPPEPPLSMVVSTRYTVFALKQPGCDLAGHVSRSQPLHISSMLRSCMLERMTEVRFPPLHYNAHLGSSDTVTPGCAPSRLSPPRLSPPRLSPARLLVPSAHKLVQEHGRLRYLRC